LEHRPGARANPAFNRDRNLGFPSGKSTGDGARTRSRGRPRYDSVAFDFIGELIGIAGAPWKMCGE
jgi:hypothetical protein